MKYINGFDEFTRAIANGNIELAKKLIKKNKKNINSLLYTIEGKTYTPLTLAITYGNIDIIKELLSIKDININKVDNSVNTPLITAINYNNINIIKELLERENIDVNKADSSNFTPLTTAINNNNIEVINELLKREDIDINNADGNRLTPIILAILKDRTEIVEKLFKKNDLDITKPEGNEEYLYEAILNKNNPDMIKSFVNYMESNLNKNINYSLLLDMALKKNNNEIANFLVENHLEQIKKENIEKLLKNCISSENYIMLIKLVNSSNSNFEEYISDNPKNYNDLVDLFYDSKDYRLINELEKGIENKINILNNEQIIKILENIKSRENPNMKLFNLLIVKIDENERKKYLEPIKDINQNKQGKNQVAINKEFILNKKTGSVEIRDVAYAKIKDKNDSSKTIISDKKLYETIYNENGSKTIIHYKADNEEILFTEKIKENKITEIKFNENDFEKINNGNKDENERKNRIINYFRDEIIKIHNIDYKNVDAFDDDLSHINYAQIYLGEYLENKEQNISFYLNLSEINNINIQAENISEEFIKSNNNKIEYIYNKIIESSNFENKDKIFIFDLGYTINPNKINIENISNCGSHTTQIVILNKKAIMINTGGYKKFDQEFIKQINEKCGYNAIENFRSINQKGSICNLASKIYTNQLTIEYKKYFGNLSKITERTNEFQNLLNKTMELKKNLKEEFKKKLKEKSEEYLNDILKVKQVVKNTNKFMKDNYEQYFDKNKDFIKFSKILEEVTNELQAENNKITEQNTSTPTLS